MSNCDVDVSGGYICQSCYQFVMYGQDHQCPVPETHSYTVTVGTDPQMLAKLGDIEKELDKILDKLGIILKKLK